MQVFQNSNVHVPSRDNFANIYRQVSDRHFQYTYRQQITALLNQTNKPATSTQRPTATHNTQASQPIKPICGQFNSVACSYGLNCNYQHKCRICYDDHPAIACPRRRNTKKVAQNGSQQPPKPKAPQNNLP